MVFANGTRASLVESQDDMAAQATELMRQWGGDTKAARAAIIHRVERPLRAVKPDG